MYAIIETGGKQYRVTPGQTIDVGRLRVPEGEAVELDRVLLVGDGDKVAVGTPLVEGARVVATCKGEYRGDKIMVFHFKAKTRHEKKTGHRQHHTRLLVGEIVSPQLASPEPKKKRPARKKVTESGS